MCALLAAWERPDWFGKVLCDVGSFTNILDAHEYRFRVRHMPPKPIRIYLQDGADDIDDGCGDWPLANRQMAATLRFRGYEYRFDCGRRPHSLAHGGVALSHVANKMLDVVFSVLRTSRPYTPQMPAPAAA